jgi:hypothetical protein
MARFSISPPVVGSWSGVKKGVHGKKPLLFKKIGKKPLLWKKTPSGTYGHPSSLIDCWKLLLAAPQPHSHTIT